MSEKKGISPMEELKNVKCFDRESNTGPPDNC